MNQPTARTTLIICDTCKLAPDQPTRDGRTGGEILAAHVEAAAALRPSVNVRRTSCLMGCERHCNAAVSAPGKIAYVLGKFEPTPDAAEALVEYAEKHAASETGAVPYREWPAGVKGHFTARIPPPPVQDDEADAE